MDLSESEELTFYNLEEMLDQDCERLLVENDVQPTEEIHEECTHKCEFGEEGFTTNGSIMEHQLHNGIWYICSACSSIFTNEEMLREHIKNFHPVSNIPFNEGEAIQHTPPQEVLNAELTLDKTKRIINFFFCTNCGKILYSKTSWKNHIAAHENNFAFPCKSCGKSFTNAASLKLHERIHNPEKKYVCSECEKAFRQKPHLEAHLRSIHLKLKPFECKTCGKAFSQMGNLKQHSFLHEKGLAQHVCSVCNARFCNASRLRRHKKIHSKSES
ncbi:hypothetical protein WA026_022310 [Henosepilachna vigintioctopunctata]|uniref:C2H2-type domain-containing protein n=1 Tax=Henosepilachna vigintioctopunctata TaxID=420089 RepID=A0AAW1VBU6_9CUCU